MTTDREHGPSSLEAQLAALAPLAEPVRRRLYLAVAESPTPMGRDEAAAAVGIARSLAAFHLDRLVDEGLLEPEYRRRSGRTGPGAGRPAKLYRRAAGTRSVSLPARNYELAARLFAEALVDDEPATGPARVNREAFEHGRALGEELAGHQPASSAEWLLDALAKEGFEPRVGPDGVVRLGNCPFHALAAVQRDLTCGMNLSLMTGLLLGLGAAGWQARLDPRPGLCCVAFEQSKEVAQWPDS
jgi:predicted ArsR family transcriptional regulator